MMKDLRFFPMKFYCYLLLSFFFSLLNHSNEGRSFARFKNLIPPAQSTSHLQRGKKNEHLSSYSLKRRKNDLKKKMMKKKNKQLGEEVVFSIYGRRIFFFYIVIISPSCRPTCFFFGSHNFFLSR